MKIEIVSQREIPHRVKSNEGARCYREQVIKITADDGTARLERHEWWYEGGQLKTIRTFAA